MSFPAIIREEMRIEARTLPDRLENCVMEWPVMQLNRDAFLFTTPRGTRFHYARGKGIAIAQGDDGSTEETDLFYNGTVYGAVAWLNGLVPLHASSVVMGGRIVAFTGDSGEGKSTLAAALGRYGFAHRSDDVLLLQFVDDGILAWPDRNRIKLCEDAFAMTGARALSPIEPGADKFFAELPQAGISDPETKGGQPLPLTDLVVLQTWDRDEPMLEPCTGASKLPCIVKAMYRIEIAIALQDEARYRRDLMSLGTGLQVWTLNRRRDRGSFESDLSRIVDQLSRL